MLPWVHWIRGCHQRRRRHGVGSTGQPRLAAEPPALEGRGVGRWRQETWSAGKEPAAHLDTGDERTAVVS